VILPLPNYALLITIVIRAAIFCCVLISSLLIFNVLAADEKQMFLLPWMFLKSKLALLGLKLRD